jgi:hypothetical protein
MHQHVHLIHYPNFSLPNSEIWIPTTSYIKPELSSQTTIGIVYNDKDNKYEFSIEGYYKKMENLVALQQGASLETGLDFPKQIINDGKGIARGMEILMMKNKGKLTGWIGYALSKSTRQFQELNEGRIFPFRYDRRHAIDISLNYHFSNSFGISASWVFNTGRPITLPIQEIETPDFHYPGNESYTSTNSPSLAGIYAERNSSRMKDYHRLDIGFKFIKYKKLGKRIWNISIYNAYNRMNPYYYYWESKKINGKNVKRLYQKTLFPIIPSVSYKFDFEFNNKKSRNKFESKLEKEIERQVLAFEVFCGSDFNNQVNINSAFIKTGIDWYPQFSSKPNNLLWAGANIGYFYLWSHQADNFDNSLNATIEIGFSPWKIERSKKLYFGTRHTFNEKVNYEQNIEDSDDGVILKSLNYLQQFFAGYQLKSLFFETGINLVNVNEIYIENDKKDISESTLTYIFPILSIGWRY